MIRVALLSDFREERWPSMDHCAAMLETSLRKGYADDFHVERLQPSSLPLATHLPWLGESLLAKRVDRLTNRMVTYPAVLRRRAGEFDLFHITDHSYSHLALGLPHGRTLITCHDLDTFRCIFAPEQEPRPLWFRAMAGRILRGFEQAHHVIFVSHTVREQAVSLGLVDPQRSSIAYNGADDMLNEDPAADAAAQALLGPWAQAPLLLHVGSTEPRKRIDLLLRVFAAVAKARPQVRLVRAGGAFTHAQQALSQELGVHDRILHLPLVDRATLGAMYRRATLLLQPSEREGFGLPVAEAMAAGCPAIVSGLPVLREIGGPAAIYIESGHVAAWTAAVLDLLALRQSDPVAWHMLRERSRQNASRFCWNENARLIAGQYHKILQDADLNGLRC